MKLHDIQTLALLVIIAACNTNQQKSTLPGQSKDSIALVSVDSASTKPNGQKEFKTKSGKTIIVHETHPLGESMSNIEVIPQDFLDNQPIQVGETDPVLSIELADLDNNGFEELYIFTQSAGSGSGGNVYAYTSEEDKALKKIQMPEITEKDIAKNGKFEGYRGHDEFKLVNNKLERTFPVYADKNTNANPGGGKKTVYYTLKNKALLIVQ